MRIGWCQVCCSQHGLQRECPGELPITGPERHGWRVNVDTPRGIESYCVLIAPSDDVWRARILTFPNVLWLAPGQQMSMKFVGQTGEEAERKAAEFIRRHCLDKGFLIRSGGQMVAGLPKPAGRPAVRKIRFLTVRFGVAAANEKAGTGNLSESGLFIITESPVDAGSWLSMSIKIDEESVPLRGLVRWASNQHHVGRAPGMGIQLSEPPRPYLSYVRSLS